MQANNARNTLSRHASEAWQSIKDSAVLNDPQPTLRHVWRGVLPERGDKKPGLPWLAGAAAGVWRAVVFTILFPIGQAHSTRTGAGASLTVSIAVAVVAAIAHHAR